MDTEEFSPQYLLRSKHKAPWPWVIALGLAVLISGMAYSIWWPDIVRHHAWYWLTPTDFWSTFRAAHFVAWGSISYVYNEHDALLSLPGFPVLLAPAALVSQWFGLTESSPWLLVPKAQAWLVAGPYMLLFSMVPLRALARISTALGLSRIANLILLVLGAAAIWPAMVMWGHPEDVVSAGLCLLCLVAALEGRWTKAGWLLGGALALQLFAILIVPVILGAAGRRRVAPLILRASVLPGFLAVAVLAPNFHQSWNTLIDQPGYPKANHPTPWILISPTIAKDTVAAGPARLIALALALACGAVAYKWRAQPERLLYLMAVALAGRCVFESVMVAYYVTPAVMASLPLALTHGKKLRAVLALTAGAAMTVVTFLHGNMWLYWGGMTALFVVMLAASWPGIARTVSDAEVERAEADGPGERTADAAALA